METGGLFQIKTSILSHYQQHLTCAEEHGSLLGHQGEGLSADGRAGYQADGYASQRSGVVDAHDCFKNCADRVDVSLLAARIPDSCVQDVPPVQNQDEHMDFGGLQTLLWRTLLRKERFWTVVFKDASRVWATANNALQFLVFYSFQICTEVCREPTYAQKNHNASLTPQLQDQYMGAEHTRGFTHGIRRKNRAGGWGGLSLLGLFRGLWRWGLCGAAAYHSARRPKVFTYWLVPCNLDGGNRRAISLASKWATHLNTRGQKGSGTRIPALISLIQRLVRTNISWSSTNKHLSSSLGLIHSGKSKRQWRKFRFGVF